VYRPESLGRVGIRPNPQRRLNQETIRLYWSIGQNLSSRFAAEGWGTKVVDQLAKNLGTEFPGVGVQPPQPSLHAFLRRRGPIGRFLQLAAKLPWGHHMVLLDRLKDGVSREWYLRVSVEHGWSRNVLPHHISTQLREREGKALRRPALLAPRFALLSQAVRSTVRVPLLQRSRTAWRHRK
jgi:predicted nuclease of restriction endonuclease-like (RecB) superfamily